MRLLDFMQVRDPSSNLALGSAKQSMSTWRWLSFRTPWFAIRGANFDRQSNLGRSGRPMRRDFRQFTRHFAFYAPKVVGPLHVQPGLGTVAAELAKAERHRRRYR